MNAITNLSLPWSSATDLDELLSDDVTIAVMRADHVTPADIRRLFGALRRASNPQSAGSARISIVPSAS